MNRYANRAAGDEEIIFCLMVARANVGANLSEGGMALRVGGAGAPTPNPCYPETQ